MVLAEPDAVGVHHAIAASFAQALRERGHAVTLRDLHEEAFVPAMSPAERAAYHGDEPVIDAQVRAHVADVATADALVFVYPTTLTTLPAILKGWLERVMVPGVGFVFDADNRVRPGLTHVRSITGISTYPTSRARQWWLNDNGRRTLARALRLSTGLRTRVRWLALHPTDIATPADLEHALMSVRDLAGRL